MSIDRILDQAIGERIFPGAVVGLCTPAGQTTWARGRLTYETDSALVTPQTVYDVASVTKTIPTSCLVWKLVEEDRLDLTQKVKVLLPEWKGSFTEQVEVWHLLAHAVRYGNRSLAQLSVHGREKLLESIWSMPPIEPPGTSFFYTNLNSILLGWILERVSGQTLSELAQQYFWEPLQMRNTSFFVSPEEGELAPTEYDPLRKKYLHGIVHDESARVLSHTKEVVGSAGLFSTVEDLLKFLQMVLSGGEKTYSLRSISRMFQPQPLADGQAVGLGWELDNSSWMGETSTSCFGKTGFTGCCVAVWPERKLGMVMLSNAVHPQRPADRQPLNRVRREIIKTVQSQTLSLN